MTVLTVIAALDAFVAVSFAVSIAITLRRFNRSAHEGLFDAAAGTSPLRGPR